jgi:pyruvate formate lyase activating enzyme
MREASLYKTLSNNLVQCQLCNHFCKIHPEKTGLCGVRQNVEGTLYTLVYNNPIALHIDPIEKKPFYHFLPNTKALSLGTIGCNFRCTFCQNAQTSQLKGYNQALDLLEKLDEITPEKVVDFCLRNDIPTIAYTYNEPTVFFEYTYDIAKLAHKKGIKNVYVSNGYMTKNMIDKIAPYLDGINIDLKAFTEEFYNKLCGAKLEPVKGNIKYFIKKGIWTEVTTLVIPGENDSYKELEDIASFLANISTDIPWHISRFHPAYKMLNKEPTSKNKLQEAYAIGKEAKLKYVYLGNVVSQKEKINTYCPKCNELLIDRSGYTGKIKNLNDRQCANCQNQIPGVWS